MKSVKNILFGVLNLVQGAMVGLIPLLIPSRSESINNFLVGVAVVMLLAGPLLVFAGKWGRIYAIFACLFYWLFGLVAICVVVFSASYLYGIYGHYGQTAGILAGVTALFLAVMFWLIPAHELHFLKKAGVGKNREGQKGEGEAS